MRLLKFGFIGIEIAIGIEIEFHSLVPKSHLFSISIAIPISIWIVPTCSMTRKNWTRSRGYLLALSIALLGILSSLICLYRKQSIVWSFTMPTACMKA